MLLASFPLLDAFWTILWVFAFVFWVAILVTVVFDLFRDKDLSGFAKAMWLLFVIVLPLVGVLVYLIARGHGMSDRLERRMIDEEAATRQYIEDVASQAGVADQLSKLSELHDRGELSDDEYSQAKRRLVA